MNRSGNPKISGLWAVKPVEALRQVVYYLAANGGDISATARSMNLSRNTLNRWIREHRELRISLERIREENV